MSGTFGAVPNFVEFVFGVLHYDKTLIREGGLILGGNFKVIVGRAVGQSCSATRMFGSSSIFAPGQGKVMQTLDRVHR